MKTDILRRYLILLTLLVSGCSLLPETKQYNVYTLPAIDMPSQSGTKSELSLRIATPYANQTLDSTRIIVMPEKNRLTSYKGARWSDRLPVLLRDQLIDAFRRDGRIQASSAKDNPLNSDMVLMSEISAFQSEYRNGIPQAHIKLYMQIMEQRTRKVIASQHFEQFVYCENKEISAVVDAFGIATTRLTNDILTWVINNQPTGGSQND